VLVALVGACGKKTEAPVTKQDAGAGKTIAAPIALPPLGVDRISRFNFLWNEGGNAYDKALTAYKAKTRDWAAVRAACELAVQKDPQHLDAQRLLAVALAQQGDHAAAVDHIVAAIAGDYFKYGLAFPTDPELAEFRATPHGQAVAALATQIRDEYQRRIKTGLWLIGRRGPFKWPAKDGVQAASSRGEVYAYDRDSHRYLRLTHTDHQVTGFVRAPSGAEIAILGFDKIDHPKDDAQPPLLARAWIELVDANEWKLIGKRVVLPSTRAAAVGYAAGDQVLAGTAPASGRWGVGEWTVSSIDKSTGKLAKVSQPLPTPRIELTLDEGRVVRDLAGVDAPWTGEPAVAPTLKVGNATIQVPESHLAARDSVALAPDKAHVAFATAVDPCAKDSAPSLYVANTQTAALKHLLTAKSRFATRWLDATTLAYDDGDGDIRLWDPSTGREAMKLDDKNGLALDVLSVASEPQCKQAPPSPGKNGIETGSAGSDDALPPEEPTP